MSTPKKFAVLLKPTELQPALDRAVQYARVNQNFDIVAVRVINEYTDDQKDQILSREKAAFEKLQRKSSLDNMTLKVVFNKDVAQGFLDECEQGNYDLAIISANKRHTLKDMFVSTIDSSIMRKGKIPLLIVREASETSSLGHSVLLAIDFMEVAHLEKLDDYLYLAASSFAKCFDGRVHVANCVTPHNSGMMGGNLDESKIVAGGIANPMAVHMQLASEFAKKHGISDDHVHVVQGRIDEEIPRLCEQLNARMVCMSTTPRSTFFGSVNSSASELVLEQIKGDVFIVNSENI